MAVVHRPWGTYETILEEERFLVKRITVDPGQRLSLQLHHHRAEHWVVVQGVATVTNGDDTFELCRDHAAYIPVGGRHRVANNTDEVVVMIEVQVGDQLEEDDIVRLEDVYGRA